MSDFSGLEDLLQDFLQEANELLSDVDNKLVDLEKSPEDRGLLDSIFRGFHTIKGGGGFLNATELVKLCHLTESLFDNLRTGKMRLTSHLIDIIMSSTKCIRDMFDELSENKLPAPANPDILSALKTALEGNAAPPPENAPVPSQEPSSQEPSVAEPDWEAFFRALTGDLSKTEAQLPAAPALPDVAVHQLPQESGQATDQPPATENDGAHGQNDEKAAARGSTIRVDMTRLDHVLNLSNEISLTRNHLSSLRSAILSGKNDPDTMHALDQAVSQLDRLVYDLQNSVMRTQMQPVARLFQKYPRIVRDLARQLGKDVELVLLGEDTEINRNLTEDLADPLIHLVRNAVDHGIELPEERKAFGKRSKGVIRIEARQEGGRFILVIADDGSGMSPEKLRQKAVEKGLVQEKDADAMDERQSLNLIFLPGFSTLSQASSVSGRGVGMDVVKNSIEKLNGSIDVHTSVGEGSIFTISLPLTLALLPVLLVSLAGQPFALPLSMVREILPIDADKVQEIGGKETLLVRGEILPVIALSRLLGWTYEGTSGYGVLIETAEWHFILSVDSFIGHDSAVVKPIDDFRPQGVAGVTTLPSGQIVLILNMKELLSDFNESVDEILSLE